MYELKKEEELTSQEIALDRTKKIFNSSFNVLQAFVMVGAVLVMLYLILITPHQVDGISMDPTFKDKEYLIANKLVYQLKEPKRGDVVIFKFSKNRDFIKRIIAIPGDTIQLVDGKYFLNGRVLNEEYIDESVYTNSGAYLNDGEILVIPEGKVFVSGDNRQYSSDSRAFGPVEVESLKGKVIVVVYPLSSIRLINNPF